MNMDVRFCPSCTKQMQVKRLVGIGGWIVLILLILLFFPAAIICYLLYPKRCVVCEGTNHYVTKNSGTFDYLMIQQKNERF